MKLLNPNSSCLYVMRKKNLSAILIILLALLLIAIVIWLYDKRIQNVEKKMKPVPSIDNIRLRHF